MRHLKVAQQPYGRSGVRLFNRARQFWSNGYVQDERYIAIDHMDVRRDYFRFARQSNAKTPNHLKLNFYNLSA
ncbi:MAG: hypothetical protein KJO80_00655, partial [Gammaproteobacteria bacterium]|nr:hypothetical protein [Gammaproteobacteria bacterium]